MIQRCPECGQRLTSNYCDICMRKVPFHGVKQAKHREPWEIKDGSSAHRMEHGHECVSFEIEEKKPLRKPAAKRPAAPPKKILQKIAVFIAVFSLVPSLLGILEETTGTESIAAPEPEVNVYDGFVAAGDPGAEDMPKVTPGELYNEDGVRVTVDAAGLSYGDYTIYMTIYNETDHKISVSTDLLSVNGYMISNGLYQDVKAGKSEQTYLTFYDFELEKAGIEKVGKVEFVLDIYDEYNYESTRKLVAIETDYPMDYSAITAVSGAPLYSDEDLTVILQDINLDSAGDCELDLYVQNHSQNTVSIYSETVWIDGEEVSCFIWNMLRPNTCAVDNAYIYELNVGSLDEVGEITIDLEIEFMDDFELLEMRRESITFKPDTI